MTELRKVDVSFADQLVDLWVETFYQAYDDKHSPENLKTYTEREYTLAAAQKMLAAKDHECIVAFNDGEAVGFYVNKYHPCPIAENDGLSVELKQIYILSDQFGSGLGRKLLENTYETARAAGAKNMWLIVVDINQRARSFYLKQSFEEIGVGPVLKIGTDHITSKYMIRSL